MGLGGQVSFCYTEHPWRHRCHLLVCSWDHSANVSYKYEGVLKVVRRSRATLIFVMGVLIV